MKGKRKVNGNINIEWYMKSSGNYSNNLANGYLEVFL